MRVIRTLIALVLITPGLAAAQSSDPDFRIKLIGRIQSQFNTTSIDEAELVAAGLNPSPIPASTFEMRRLRFGSDVEYKKWLTGKIELEFAMARLQMRDAYINLGFDPAFNLRFGQFKKPFSFLQLYSDAVWPMIERGVRIRGLSETLAHVDSTAPGNALLSSFRGNMVFPEEQELLQVFGYQDYDVGAAIHGKVGHFGYTVGAFNGTGSDRAAETSGKSYASRLTYRLPIELPVTLGAGMSHREYRLSARPTIQTNAGTAYEVDVEIGAFRRAGLHVIGEVAFGENLAVADDDFMGAQAVTAWFQPVDNSRIDGVEFHQASGAFEFGTGQRQFAALVENLVPEPHHAEARTRPHRPRLQHGDAAAQHIARQNRLAPFGEIDAGRAFACGVLQDRVEE